MNDNLTREGYISLLRSQHEQVCYENGDHPDEVDTAYSVGADAIELLERWDRQNYYFEQQAVTPIKAFDGMKN